MYGLLQCAFHRLWLSFLFVLVVSCILPKHPVVGEVWKTRTIDLKEKLNAFSGSIRATKGRMAQNAASSFHDSLRTNSVIQPQSSPIASFSTVEF